MAESTGMRAAPGGARPAGGLCWACRAPAGTEPVCGACGRLQPLPRDVDYFAVLGLPRRLCLDPQTLEPAFHALSRLYHPDRHRMGTPRERLVALDNSAVLNKAYRALRDPFERAAYLLQVEEGRALDGKDAPPQDLFEEILEIQELLETYRHAGPKEREAARPQLAARHAELRSEWERRASELTGDLFRRWDGLHEGPAAPPPAERAAILGEIRRILGERAYLRRILDRLDETL